MRINRIAVVVSFACVLALALVAAGSANAQNLLTNWSFEDPSLGDGEWVQTEAPPDWYSWSGDVGQFYGDPGPDEAPMEAYHGENVVEMVTDASINQDVPLTVGAGEIYTFTVHTYKPHWADGDQQFQLSFGWNHFNDWIMSPVMIHNDESWGEYSITLNTDTDLGDRYGSSPIGDVGLT